MRTAPALTAAVLAVALTACGQGAATFQPPADETSGMISAALAALAERPVLEISGDVDGFTAEDDAASLSTLVTRNGTSFGSVELGGHTVDLMTIGDEYYARSTAGFWEAQGHPAFFAEKTDEKWTRVYPDYWFSPAHVTPAGYAAELEEEFEETGAMFTTLPEPVTVDGVPAYALPVGEGTVFIGTAEPREILRVENVPVDVIGWRVPLTVEVAGVDRERAEELRDRLDDNAGGLTSVYDAFAYVSQNEDDYTFECESGTCTYTSKISVDGEVIGYGPTPDEVLVHLSVEIEGDGGIGSKSCEDTGTVDVGGKGTLRCSARFSIPADGRTYYFDAYPETLAVAILPADGGKLADTVAGEFAGVLEEYP